MTVHCDLRGHSFSFDLFTFLRYFQEKNLVIWFYFCNFALSNN